MSDIASLNGYPNLSSRSDYYNTWLAQNSNIISIQNNQQQFNTEYGNISSGISATAGAIGDVATGNIGGGISKVADWELSAYQNSVNFDYYIQGQMAQIEKQQMLPDTRKLKF